MTEWTKNGLLQHFLPPSILLLSLISFNSSPSKIFAEGTDLPSILVGGTTRPTETTSSNKETHTGDTEAAIAEALSTEVIWFGTGEEIAIATRHETPIGKAPSIVAVITAEEIKHLGYRTFDEILRTISECLCQW